MRKLKAIFYIIFSDGWYLAHINKKGTVARMYEGMNLHAMKVIAEDCGTIYFANVEADEAVDVAKEIINPVNK